MFNINGQKAYNTKEVAQILEIQPQSVRKLIYRKRLPAITPGRDHYILESDLKELLKTRNLLQETNIGSK